MSHMKKFILLLPALLLLSVGALATEAEPEAAPIILQEEETTEEVTSPDAEEITGLREVFFGNGAAAKAVACTVSYYDGKTLLHTETVAAGEYPNEVPAQNSKGKAIFSWAMEGVGVNPSETKIQGNTDFTVWYAPALNTTDHIQYISGAAEADGSCYRFLPNGTLTRAQAAQMLYNLLSDQSPGIYEAGFSDVPSSAWYYEAVQTLASDHILSGYHNGKFCPNASVTRAEFVTMLCRLISPASGTASFTDVQPGGWYYDAVASACQMGWVHGYDDGTFGPNQPITRAEAVAIINRALGRSADRETVLNGKFLLYTDVADPSFWAFDDIMEASVSHKYKATSGDEVWTSYTLPPSGLSAGLKTLSGAVWYVDSQTGVFIRSQWRSINGARYYFGDCGTKTTGLLELDGQWFYCDPDQNGAAVTGSYCFDGYRYTLEADGGTRLSEKDYMTAKIKNKSSATNWLLAVDITACKTGVYYYKDSQWQLQYFLTCSPGAPGHETPTGTYKTGVKGYSFYSYGSWQYYYTGFIGGEYLFHSITYNADGSVQDGTLGERVSHGCVRLSLADAKWIYKNIPTNTTVYIYE